MASGSPAETPLLVKTGKHPPLTEPQFCHLESGANSRVLLKEMKLVGLEGSDKLSILRGCPGLPGAPGPKGEAGIGGLKGTSELRVDLVDFEGNHRFAKHQPFRMVGEAEKYKLVPGAFVVGGAAGDSLTDHRSHFFCTEDRDRDGSASSCACREMKLRLTQPPAASTSFAPSPARVRPPLLPCLRL
ncbi:hypothetical protein G4228_007583 [Cervus hanglu yarkandensis]|nr:hypothetical protein G4228_007583 [Cervus hanglu yarkandensis]